LYLDDICVFSENIDEHLNRLDRVLKSLIKANLTLKPSKCKFLQEEMKFLGHVINKNGLKPDYAKIQTIKELPVPQNIKTLRSYLGLFSYYRRFIDNFSKIANPLTSLTKKNEKFSWDTEKECAFRTLQQKLTNPPILSYFYNNRKTEIRTDASDAGLGAILSQYESNGNNVVIEYASRSLTKSEKNYSTTEKELLAVVFAIYKFKPYITGIHFIIKTDHHALCFVMRKPELAPRLARWVLLLQEYHFTIEYKSGKTHVDADCLSRFPIAECNKLPELHDLTINAISKDNIFSEKQKSDEFMSVFF